MGAPRNNENGEFSGMMKVLEEKNRERVQVVQTISGISTNKELGSSISLSSDGERLAISSFNGIDRGSDQQDENESFVQVY